MNTLSIVAFIVIALCAAYIAYCIIGASRLLRRDDMAPPHEKPPDTTGDCATTDESPSAHSFTTLTNL